MFRISPCPGRAPDRAKQTKWGIFKCHFWGILLRQRQTLSFAYDNLNRVTQKTVPERIGLDATHTRDVFYGYDIRGLQTSVRFDSATGEGLTTAYDRYGRATSNSMNMDSATRTLGYGYDVAGNRTSFTYPDNVTFSMTYGTGGWLNELKDASGNILVDFNYDTLGRIDQLARNSSAPEQDFAYDGLGRLDSTGWANAGSNSVNWSFTRNAASQIKSETQTNDSYAWNNHAVFDRTYVTNGLNQYSTVASSAYCYDANGNLLADGAKVYLYDGENRLVEMRTMVGTACPTSTSGYTGTILARLRYDPLGRLYEVETYSGGVYQWKSRFVYDGDALVAEYTTGGAVVYRHVHGPLAGSDDPLITYGGASAAYTNARFLYADPRGSIVYSANKDNNFSVINTYDVFGQPGSDNYGRFQYTGQVWLAELGMYYYKARIYSPALGRFLQTDPVGYEDQVNLYAYVGSDPINGVDPTGMFERGDSLQWNSGLGKISGTGGIVSDPQTRNAVANAAPSNQTTSSTPPGQGHNGGPPLEEDVVSNTIIKVLGRLAGRVGGALVSLLWSEPVGEGTDQVGPTYTEHAEKRMNERGISDDRVREALQHGKQTDRGDRIEYAMPSGASISGRGLIVSYSKTTGQVITVIDRGSRFVVK